MHSREPKKRTQKEKRTQLCRPSRPALPPFAPQLQYSLLDTRPVVAGMSALCAQRGISLLPYGVLAGGLLSDAYRGVAARE